MFLHGSYKFQFDWKLTLLVLVLLPLLLRLGFWQLEREAEKQELQDLYTARQTEPAVPLQTMAGATDVQYRQVHFAGNYDKAHIFLLDNRTHAGQAGFEVLMPFLTNEGQIVIVNRGWVAQDGNRQAAPLPEVSNGTPTLGSDGTVTLQGSINMPVGEQFVLGDTQPGPEWPKIIQRLEIPELAQLAEYPAGIPVFPYSIRLAAGSPGVLERNWTIISTTPEKHRGYAVQWFAMSAALFLLYLHRSFRTPDPGTATANHTTTSHSEHHNPRQPS